MLPTASLKCDSAICCHMPEWGATRSNGAQRRKAVRCAQTCLLAHPTRCAAEKKGCRCSCNCSAVDAGHVWRAVEQPLVPALGDANSPRQLVRTHPQAHIYFSCYRFYGRRRGVRYQHTIMVHGAKLDKHAPQRGTGLLAVVLARAHHRAHAVVLLVVEGARWVTEPRVIGGHSELHAMVCQIVQLRVI